jgi:hypothetical protein
MEASRTGQGFKDTKDNEVGDDMEDTEDPLAKGHEEEIYENETAPGNSKNLEDIIIVDID